MAPEVELAGLDLRYEGFRLKQPALEERLLASIAQRGIEEPLEGVEVGPAQVLLNGFKRYRCARKLHIATVPYCSLGQDEAGAIVSLLKLSNHRTLSILEQAVFIAELKNALQMNVAEIALELSRSKSWVTMRLGLLSEMSAKVRQQLFAGAFPVYSYMYLIRSFMRMNGVKAQEIDEFVVALSGQRFRLNTPCRLRRWFLSHHHRCLGVSLRQFDCGLLYSMTFCSMGINRATTKLQKPMTPTSLPKTANGTRWPAGRPLAGRRG